MKIKVGDKVQVWKGITGWSDLKYEVLHIHKVKNDDRVWVTVAYMGDCPTSYSLNDVRLVPYRFCLKDKTYEVSFVNGKPDWDSVREYIG